MKIDEATGLPELPEDCLWEVLYLPSEFGEYTYRRSRDAGYYIQLKRRETWTEKRRTNHRRVRNPEYRFMGKHVKWLDVYDTVEDVKTEDTVVEQRRISLFDSEAYDKAQESYKERIALWRKVWGELYSDYSKTCKLVDEHNSMRYTHRSYAIQEKPEWRGEPRPVRPTVEAFTSYTLTEEAILSTATEIVLTLEERARQDALLGEYPPNKLSTK